MAENVVKITLVVLVLSLFWAFLYLEQQYSDAKIISALQTDVEQSFRKKNLFLKGVRVRILRKGAVTAKNEIPVKVNVQYEPPLTEYSCPRAVSKDLELLVSKNESGDVIIKNRDGIELGEISELSAL